MQTSTLYQLDALIKAAGIPIDGVADTGNGTFRIDFQVSATQEQKTQAASIAASWVPVPIPDPEGLVQYLRGNNTFKKLLTFVRSGNASAAVQGSFHMMYSTLCARPFDVASFQTYLQDMITAMGGTATAGDKAALNTILTRYGFSFTVA